MTRTLLRAGVALCALLATTTPTAAILAQTGPNPPPRQDTMSPTGVSYYTGAFSHQEGDLSIGGGGFPQGLSLDRSYLSSLDQAVSAYAGFGSQGWSHNLVARFGNSIAEIQGFEAPEGQKSFLYSITIGARSVGFSGGSTNPTGGFVGSYQPIELSGASLEFAGAHTTGNYTFIDADGTTLVFNSLSAANGALAVSTWTAPDGTRLDFTYVAHRLRSVISSRGYALLFEYGAVPGGTALTRACAVNMAVTYVTATSACPVGAQAVTYQYSAGGTVALLTGATNAAGQPTSYGYDTREHLDCITLPGQSVCQVSNSYGQCTPRQNPDAPPEIPYGYLWHEPVLSQVTATGETYSYSFPAVQECPVERAYGVPPTTMTANASATTTVVLTNPGLPTSVTDPLNRVTSMDYFMSFNALPGVNGASLAKLTYPQDNTANYAYDSRGNIIEQRLQAVPGSGAADIVTGAAYPPSCDATNRRICNRPTSVTDANGNTTDYTYEAAHGGVRTETGPTVNGVRPQTRFTYVQRHAWIRNSGGAYSQVATSIWLPASESRCIAGAPHSSGTGCANGASDEVLTQYDYGPNSGPNNLVPRGMTVTAYAGGAAQTLRTCYGYDGQGNRISETAPRAGLTSCP